MREELIAPCGMNCGICSSYLALEKNLKTQGIRIPYCRGCRPRNKNCAFLKKRCGKLAENQIRYCYECSVYPCNNLVSIDNRYKELYKMSMISSLEFIKNNGMDLFLAAERHKWVCSRCGGTISCHNGICYSCNYEKLNKLKSLYRWENP